MRDLDTFDLLPESIDHDRVAAEQFPPIEMLVHESFASPRHRAMLLHHEWQLAKDRQDTSAADELMGPTRLRIAHEEAEGWTARTEMRDAGLINIANQAHQNRRSA
jgi:hypothetical protein